MTGIGNWRPARLTTTSMNSMFLKFMESGPRLSQGKRVNWDPVENTVLANERGRRMWLAPGAPVERRLLSQWFLKITEYADDLLEHRGARPLARPCQADAAELDRPV